MLPDSSKPVSDKTRTVQSTKCFSLFLTAGVSWGGEMSNAMQNRLQILESLRQYFTQNNLSHLEPIIDNLGVAYQKKIDAEIENELSDSRERNRFDW